jgi:HD-GYP domain-containing protein (c-di-GMP phosphodiesterase class II)
MLAVACGAGDPDKLEFCGVLHDIGKIDVPDSILEKPGALTEVEFEIVKKHTNYGYDRLLTAANISRQHHEKWDGSGYIGLKADEIHPWARIVCVADVVDALMSKRAYKEAWSPEETFEYMQKQSGRMFDPLIIKALLRLKEDIEKLYAAPQNP